MAATAEREREINPVYSLGPGDREAIFFAMQYYEEELGKLGEFLGREVVGPSGELYKALVQPGLRRVFEAQTKAVTAMQGIVAGLSSDLSVILKPWSSGKNAHPTDIEIYSEHQPVRIIPVHDFMQLLTLDTSPDNIKEFKERLRSHFNEGRSVRLDGGD